VAARDRQKQRLEARGEARPVPGRVIRGNILSPLRYAGLGLFLITVCLLFLAWLAGETSPQADFLRVRPYVGLFYGILLVVGSCLTVSILAARNRRMIIGEDRLQLVGGLGRVIGQLPYDNIIEAQMGADGSVEIILDKLRRRDTWWPGLGKREDCGVAIGPGLEVDPTAIRLYLRDVLRVYWDQRGGRAWEQR
jgi:hypothetical protein